jgi:RNA polymerase sigma-70 factor (ECF subfamily)
MRAVRGLESMTMTERHHTGSPRPTTGELEAFYAQAMPMVYRYFLARCGGNTAIAEDLTQDTMLSAASEIRRGRFGDVPIPWVLGIARHRLLDHYARSHRERRRLTAWSNEFRVRNQADDPPDDASDRVHAALAGLPAAQRAVVVLHHLDGLPVADIAALIDRTPAATESLLTRGRAGLRQALKEVGADE